MQQQTETRQKSYASDKDKPLTHCAQIVIVTLIVVAAMAILAASSAVALRIANKSAPLIDASMEVKYELSLFHLWFEELVQQDPTVDKVTSLATPQPGTLVCQYHAAGRRKLTCKRFRPSMTQTSAP